MTVPQIAELQAPAAWGTVDFISDLHLTEEEPATFAAWQRYMEKTPADAVFILGDLFEVWVGDDAVNQNASTAMGFEDRCVQVMTAASARLALFFMHGNRDFLVGQRLMDLCHAALLTDPTVLQFAGQRFLLSHGDALCLADTAYLQFRQQVRSSAWQEPFLAQPLSERQSIARGLRAQSEARKQTGQTCADVDTHAAKQWLQAAGASTLIHGHTHQPSQHDLGDNQHRVVLSDWDACASPPRVEVLRLTRTGLQRLPLAVER
ncbi:MAG: UDP-2,3-diacylglucosamine diphosphatase [Polaromonas sp.]|jgi:UDP-2,3-diacylglucosamine hydrolase|nr:UDP-2,3-diacylglucosamine diphosphatase [Polaromonas sp.]